MDIEQFVIIGGTHGDELCGSFLVEEWQRAPAELQRDSIPPPVLVIGNPAAVAARTRFIDEDLNRQFSKQRLLQPRPNVAEAVRAQELNTLLKSKRTFALDLHTTTANMGITLITHGSPKAYGLRLATYAQAWLRHSGHTVNLTGNGDAFIDDSSTVSEAAHFGLIVEIGPCPPRVLRYDVVESMRSIVRHLLDAFNLDRRERLGDLPLPDGRPFPEFATVMSFKPHPPPRQRSFMRIACPTYPDGKPRAMLHPHIQDNDYLEIKTGDPLFIHFDGSIERYGGEFGSRIVATFINDSADYKCCGGSGVGLLVVVPTRLPVLSRSTMSRL